MARRKKNPDLGNVAFGVEETPVVATEAMLDNEDKVKKLEEKIAEYRKDNPEPPKENKPNVAAPLNIKRVTSAIDNEYVELAKRYLGMDVKSKPTMVDFAKAIIRLFEDNMKLYKKMNSMKGTAPMQQTRHMWQHSSQWN